MSNGDTPAKVGSMEGLGLDPKRDALAEQLACVRQALPDEWRDSVPSVAVATLVAELELQRKSSAHYFSERNSARDAWRERVNQCEVLARWIAEVLPALDVAEALEDFEDGGEHLRMLKDRGERLVAAMLGTPPQQPAPNGPQCNLNTPWIAP